MIRLVTLCGYIIHLVCPACRHESAFVAALDHIAEYGAETKLDAVLARCRRTSCGRKGVPRVTMSWTQTAELPQLTW